MTKKKKKKAQHSLGSYNRYKKNVCFIFFFFYRSYNNTHSFSFIFNKYKSSSYFIHKFQLFNICPPSFSICKQKNLRKNSNQIFIHEHSRKELKRIGREEKFQYYLSLHQGKSTLLGFLFHRKVMQQGIFVETGLRKKKSKNMINDFNIPGFPGTCFSFLFFFFRVGDFRKFKE